MLVVLFVAQILSLGDSQKEGDSCVDKFSNMGLCTLASRCKSAREDFERDRTPPTFCNQATHEPTVCCREGISNGTDLKNISQLKCEEYHRQIADIVPWSAHCKSLAVPLVLGGENTELGEFPHMAAIGWSNPEGGYTFFCGGSLISPRWVLTAAHCTYNPRLEEPAPKIVRLGDYKLDSVDDGAKPIDVPIKSMVKHPEYMAPKRYNDIALFELATDVEFTNEIRPACLWRDAHFDYTSGTATGWGVTDRKTQQKTGGELQKVSLALFDVEICRKLLANNFNRNWLQFRPTQLCAGELRGGKGTCQGDSGGPLQTISKDNRCIYHIIGVTSFGHKCALENQPTVFSRVSSYLDWIESIVWAPILTKR